MNRHNVSLLILTVSLMAILPASASSEIRVSAGIKGGLNLTMPAGDELSGRFDGLEWIDWNFDSTTVDLVELNSIEVKKMSSMTSFLVGGFVNIQVSEMFSIQPEFLYVRKGATQDLEAGTTILTFLPVNFKGKLSWKLDYIEIPVLAKLTVPTDGSITPCFFAGPAVSFAINSNVEAAISKIDETFDIDPLVASTEFSVVMGAGIDFDISPTSFLVLDGRYELGLSDWTDEPIIDIVSVKNGGLQFMAGFGFRFGGGE